MSSMPSMPKRQLFPELPTHMAAPEPSDGQNPDGAQDGDQLMQVIQGMTHGGAAPMQPGGTIQLQYPSLRAASHADWRMVNPRLLEALDKEAEKRGSVIVIHSGYRDHGHNTRVGGHPQSSHKRGTAVDAFIHGHPLGEVIGADELAKLGIAVGGPHGHDAAHVEIRGIPMKMPKAKAVAAKASASKPATQSKGASKLAPLAMMPEASAAQAPPMLGQGMEQLLGGGGQ